MLVAFAVVLLTIGVHTTAQAANLTFVSNTLTDSAPNALSGHEIAFTIPAGSTLLPAATTTITFPAGFTNVDTVTSGDVVVTVEGTPDAVATFDATGQVIQFTGINATGSEEVIVTIDAGIIQNPAGVDSYEFVIATPSDIGYTQVAIVDTVLVTASVETTFDFVISGTATGTAINGTTTTGATSVTEIPFGVLDAWMTETLAQELSVVTNARNGFVVTVEQDGDLESSTGAIIDGFIDGSYVNTPTAWQAPANTILSLNTYGHWGLTSDDSDLNANEFNVGSGGDRWVAASTTPREIFSHDGPSDGVEQDVGLATVGYQIQISPLQEAGDDYETTLTYIATPTF